jgi:hypothetical protein
MGNELATHAVTVLIAVAPFVFIGLIGWGKIGERVDGMLAALNQLTSTIEKLTTHIDAHGDRITRIETKVDYIEASERNRSERPRAS